MAYRGVPRMEIGEVIRRWQAGHSQLRSRSAAPGNVPLAGERNRRSNSRGTGNQVSGTPGGFPTDSPRFLNSPPTSAPAGIAGRFPTELSGGHS